MKDYSLGFIGGGRVTSIMLGGLRRAGELPQRVFVTDSETKILEGLKKDFPEITVSLNDSKTVAGQDIVFLALHPPAISEVAEEIRGGLRESSILISLAPKIKISSLSQLLAGFNRIARMIPNAPSIIGTGYNPITFSDSMGAAEKKTILELLSPLGTAPVVPEEKLEAYAILTAMGPTYLWFQLRELEQICSGFGLSSEEIRKGIKAMTAGAVYTLYESNLTADKVMDLVPVKPLLGSEELIKSAYQKGLQAIHERLTA